MRRAGRTRAAARSAIRDGLEPGAPSVDHRAMNAAATAFEGSSRFAIERSLGAGGMGIVYLAHDRERDMRVALKTLVNADPTNLARLKNEFRALAQIAHPNLVELYELFADEGRWFFTMEAVEGVRFDAWVAALPRPGARDLLITTRAARRTGIRRKAVGDHGPSHDAASHDAVDTITLDDLGEDGESVTSLPAPIADLAKLRRALDGLVDGIEALHRGNKLHCDLKPSNVLVTPEGRVVVLDFGLVRERPRREGPAAQMIEGTPEYVAPEVVRGMPPRPAADWYSVGVMIFQALTGRFPHRGDSFWATLAQKLERDAPRASSMASGVPPELDALCAALLERDPAQRAGGAAIRAWLAGAPAANESDATTPEAAFVGRGAELATLHLLFEEAAGGGPRSVFVRGPSGMGKSALVHHFVDELERDGRAIVLAGRCYEREQVPFKTLDNVVDVLAARLARMPGTVVAELVPEEASALAVLFPVLRAVDAIADLPPPAESLDPSEVRARAAHAARTILGRLSRIAPVVIAIDDLQWGDVDSASLAADLVDRRSADRLLFVASVRSEAADSEVVRAFRASMPRPVDLDLRPLAAADSTALARSILGPHDDAERTTQIVREAAGVPFFLAELARYRARAQKSSRDTGATTLDDVIAARVGELPDDARALLEAACVAGLPLPPRVLARACGSSRDLLPSLRLLGAQSLLRTRHGEGVEVEAYHDRIREVVAARVDAARRRTLHAGLGDALSSERNADPETIAEHLARGGDAARALPFQLRAAERAQHALAFDRAVSL
ncbi:MAG: AAA family ATPase, partial [Myxococcota bacterium]|nr:AAA family ATPase [Myxococcota bacterium]